MEMDRVDKSMAIKISALWNVIALKRSFKEDKIPCQIEEGLFLGSIGAACNEKELKRLNITHILTVAKSLPPSNSCDFVQKFVSVFDTKDTDIKQHFDDCFNFIDEAKQSGGGVLVHCFAGVSRSVTITVAYLMKKRGMSLTQALEHVKSRRQRASPNVGFMIQLKDYETALQASREEERKLTNNSESSAGDT